MKVLVKQDSANVTPVDVGEGEGRASEAAKLVSEFGSGVTNEDGSPVVLTEPVAPAVAKKKSRQGHEKWVQGTKRIANDQARIHVDSAGHDRSHSGVRPTRGRSPSWKRPRFQRPGNVIDEMCELERRGEREEDRLQAAHRAKALEGLSMREQFEA